MSVDYSCPSGYVTPKIDVPSNLSELILTGDGAIVRVQQIGMEWIAVLHRDGELDRALRAGTREEVLRMAGATEA